MVRRSSPLDSPEELDDFSDSGSDYEATLKASKRRKRPVPGPLLPKRPRRNAARRVTSSPSNNPIPTPPPDPSLQQQPSSQETPRQVSLRPGRSVDEGKQGISAKDIYDAICSGKSAMVTVVDEWLDSYKQSREAGLLVLINFIVQSCGCKGVVTQEMFGSMENAEIISSLTKEFDEDSVNYPLCTPVPQLKHFKASLCEFARVLVRSCQNSLIYDEYLFPSLLSLLTGLSDSQVRAFRHTSTLLAMKLMTGFVDIVVVVSVQLQTTQRRYDVENSKREHDRASDRLEELQATVSECIENKEELSSMMNSIFRGVFVHRYRDRLPEIRAVCIEELGIWLKTDPEDFLNDGCLKYLGWNLHDKQGPVRLQCVRTLQGLYQEKEFIGRLELFTSRFKERILSMVLDKDPDVAVEVVNLCLLMQQKTEEGLAEDECGHIYPLVYASHRALASAAGVFLYNKYAHIEHCQCCLSLFRVDNQEDNKSNNAAFLQVVISFYIQSEFHEHGAYLVDSLWGVAGSELRDWETMTAFLLQDAGLMYEEEGPLIELMMCAIKQAAQATPPVGRTQGKKVILSMKDKKIQEQDRRRITAHFIPLLPQLLAKYSADAGKVSLLLKAPLYFELEMYSSAQWLEKHLDLLLSQICGIVEKHTELTVLEACAHLVTTLCSESYTFSSRAHVAFSQLLDGLTECFSSYLSDLLQGTADDDDTYSAATALKRIAALMFFKKYLEATSSCLSFRPQAFEVLCDLLLLYSESSVRSKPALQALVHLPSDSLRSELAAFLLDYIFIDAEDTELEGILTLNEKNRKRNQLAGYCKLIIYGVLDLTAATDVFKHYSKYFKDFGDIIKETVSKSKLIDPILSAETVCLCLQQLFSEMLTDNRSREDLPEIRDLAKRLAMSFGINLHRVRKPLLALHMNGICFAFRDSPEGEEQHLNVDFLEILSEFSFKLLQQDRTQLGLLCYYSIKLYELLSSHTLNCQIKVQRFPWCLSSSPAILSSPPRADFLKSRCPSAALSWPSVRLYQHSLVARSTSKPREQEEGGDVVSSYRSPVAKRKRTAATGDTLTTQNTVLIDCAL
uniref:Cohesin subunit SA n=1 Tax=Amphiprion ocellaris TaxID=80972 RepID=A0AAQ5Z2K9_AMPOC